MKLNIIIMNHFEHKMYDKSEYTKKMITFNNNHCMIIITDLFIILNN